MNIKIGSLCPINLPARMRLLTIWESRARVWTRQHVPAIRGVCHDSPSMRVRAQAGNR